MLRNSRMQFDDAPVRRRIMLAAVVFSVVVAGAASAQPEALAISGQTFTSTAQMLAALGEPDRANARVSFELPGNATAQQLAAAQNAASLWNQGDYAHAIDAVAAVEAGGLPLAAGLQWIEPLGPTQRWSDRRIGGSRTSAQYVTLDHDAENKALFSVVSWPTGWTVNRSSDGGATWAETYSWSSGGLAIDDLDARVAGDHLYIGYIWHGDESQLRARRAFVSDGTSDESFAGIGYAVVHEAGAVAVTEIAMSSNADWADNRVYYLLRRSDNTMRFYFESLTNPTVFTERTTGVVDAAGGIDLHVNPGYAEYFLFASYVATGNTVNVIRLNSLDIWSAPTVVDSMFNGTTVRTALSAYDETVICAYESSGGFGIGVGYRISYNAGNSWVIGSMYTPPSGGSPAYSIDVTARGGFGTAAIYGLEAGEFDPLNYQARTGYSGGTWSPANARNEVDLLSGSDSAIDWIPPRVNSPGSYSYGMVFISDAPYFERADVCTSDLDGDNRVDPQDLALLLAAYLTIPGDPHWDPAADLSGDNLVSAQDLAYLLGDFLKTCN